MSAGWPWLEQQVRDRIVGGGIVTRQGAHVQIEMPGGSISWTRTEYFDRAVGADLVSPSAIAVMPAAPFDRPIVPLASSGLLDFLNTAATTRYSARGQGHDRVA